MLIKVAIKVGSDSMVFSTNFAMPKICFIPYKATCISIAIFIAEVAYLFHRFAVQNTPLNLPKLLSAFRKIMSPRFTYASC